MKESQYEPVFCAKGASASGRDSFLFVTIRKRIGAEAFDAMVGALMRTANLIPQRIQEETKDKQIKSENGLTDAPNDTLHQTQGPLNQKQTQQQSSCSSAATEEQPKNAGTLIVDMSVATADHK